jgi:nicotinamide mononucleotide (NMN) deamidase PncC
VDTSIVKQYGGESTQAAKAMAETARRNLQTDIGMSIGGNMNPDKNSGQAFIGLRSDKFEQTFPHMLRGNLSRMKQRAVYAALFDLRKMLLEEG